jgi:hypothetical protein
MNIKVFTNQHDWFYLMYGEVPLFIHLVSKLLLWEKKHFENEHQLLKSISIMDQPCKAMYKRLN